MDGESLSASEAARILGVSIPTLKRMAADGEIETFRTPGGHLRVTAESLERLREGGPKEIRQRRESSPVLKNRRERVEELSLEAQELRAQRELSKLRKEAAEEAERDRQEMLRREREQRHLAERNRLEQERQEREQEEAERVRREAEQRSNWQDGWLQQALGSLPKDCPKDYRARVCREVQEVLEGLDPNCADSLVQELVDAGVENGLHSWMRDKAIQDAIGAGERCLPIWARSIFSSQEPTEWQIILRRTAKEKIADLGENASLEEIRAAAIEAGRAVARQYQEAEAAQQRQRKQEAKQREQELTIRLGLAHVSSYLRQLEEDDEFEFEDRERLTRKLEKRIRPELLKEIEADSDLDYRDVEEIVGDLVDEFLPEFVDEE